MQGELTNRAFSIIGAIIGILIGSVVSVLQSNPLSAFITFFFDARFLFMVGILYLGIQFIIGIPMRRPRASRSLYNGMLFIPAVYLLFIARPVSPQLTDNIIYYSLILIVLAFPIAYAMVVASFIGRSIRFFVGLDRKAIFDKTLDSRAITCYSVEFKESGKVDASIVERMLNLTDFARKKSSDLGDGKRIALYEGSIGYLGTLCKKAKNTLHVVFTLFQIKDDTVIDIVSMEAALDFRGQLSGLLSSWVEREEIVKFAQTSVDYGAIEESSAFLGKWSFPSRGNIQKSISENLERSRALKWIIATIVGGGLLIVLDKLVSMFWT